MSTLHFAGVADSSGFRFYYATEVEHSAGIMIVGHVVTSAMIVPPSPTGYITSGICTPSCTSEVKNCEFPS